MTEYKQSIEKEERKCVSSNYFSEQCKQKTDEWLKQGYWVCFCCDCIGHTRAAMFENAGEQYVRDTYGDSNVLISKSGGLRYFKLK